MWRVFVLATLSACGGSSGWDDALDSGSAPELDTEARDEPPPPPFADCTEVRQEFASRYRECFQSPDPYAWRGGSALCDVCDWSEWSTCVEDTPEEGRDFRFVVFDLCIAAEDRLGCCG